MGFNLKMKTIWFNALNYTKLFSLHCWNGHLVYENGCLNAGPVNCNFFFRDTTTAQWRTPQGPWAFHNNNQILYFKKQTFEIGSSYLISHTHTHTYSFQLQHWLNFHVTNEYESPQIEINSYERKTFPDGCKKICLIQQIIFCFSYPKSLWIFVLSFVTENGYFFLFHLFNIYTDPFSSRFLPYLRMALASVDRESFFLHKNHIVYYLKRTFCLIYFFFSFCIKLFQ